MNFQLSFKKKLFNRFHKHKISLLASLIIHLFLFSALKERPLVQTNSDLNINFHSNSIKVNVIKIPSKRNEFKTIKRRYIKEKKFSKNKIKNNPNSAYESNQKKVDQTYQQILTQEFNKSIVQNVLPVYPRIALKRGWSGRVLLQILVDSVGVVKNVKIIRPSVHASLNESAVVAASQWLFKKSETGGLYQIEKEIVFKIKLKKTINIEDPQVIAF